MKRINHETNDLLIVEQQAGKLRLILFLIAIFIVWSLLALVSSIAEPISADLTPLFNFKEPANLAISLFRDILTNYFSVFTILYLLIFLLLLWCGYRLAAEFMVNVLQFPDLKTAGNYLKSCVFSKPPYPNYQILDASSINSSDHKMLATLGGPAFLTIGVDLAALTSKDSKEEYVLYAKSDQPEMFFINSFTKLKSIIDTKIQNISLSIRARCRDGHKIYLGKVNLICALNIDKDGLVEGNDPKSRQVLMEIAQKTGNSSWTGFLEEVIPLEIMNLLSNYSRAELEQALIYKGTAPLQQAHSLNSNHQTHAVSKHGTPYITPAILFHPTQASLILRNRKRSFQPEIRKHESGEPIEPPVEKEIDFLDKLSEQLSKSINSLFAIPIVAIKICEIGDITLNGKH